MPVQGHQNRMVAVILPVLETLGQGRHQAPVLPSGFSQLPGHAVVFAHLEEEALRAFGFPQGENVTGHPGEGGAALLPGILVQPAGRLARGLGVQSFQSLGYVQGVPLHHQSFRGQIFPQGLGLRIELRQMPLEAGKVNALLHVLPEPGVPALAASLQGPLPGGLIQDNFADGKHHQVFQRGLGTLGGRVEEAQ